MNEQGTPAQQSRLIVVDADGHLSIVGAWKVRELLAVSQMIAQAANESELTFAPPPAQA